MSSTPIVPMVQDNMSISFANSIDNNASFLDLLATSALPAEETSNNNISVQNPFTVSLDNTVANKDVSTYKEEVKSHNSRLDNMINSDVESITPPSNKDAGSLAIDFLIENELLVLPSGKTLTPENYQEVIAYTKEHNINLAIEEIISNIEDPAYKEAVKSTIYGGTLEDVNTTKQYIEWENAVRQININTEAGQRAMLEHYYSLELNPESSMYELMKATIAKNIDDIIVQGIGSTEATKAFNNILIKINKGRQEIQDRVEANNRKIIEAKAKKAKKMLEWQRTFLKDLKNSNWSPAEQNKILDLIGTSKSEDGKDIPYWEYALSLMLKDPHQVKFLFKFLSDFDINTKSFKNTVVSPQESATNRILSSVNVNNSKTIGAQKNIQNNNTKTASVFFTSMK